MAGARRYHEPQECPDCHKTVATLVPWHGDGSLALFVAHGPTRARCTGSRQAPPNNAETPKRWRHLNTFPWPTS